MKVISNASVLIGLSSIGMFFLLRERFPEAILVPEAVWREVVDEGAERSGTKDVSAVNWIKVQKINDKGMVRLLRAELDEGEAEAIALAYEMNANLVLLDERDARRVPLMEEIGVDYRLDSTHFIEYTQEGFVQELASAGLEVVHMEIRWGEIWCEARLIT